ncbi:MAG TPA: hypothetical protein PLL66_08405, partial [Bacteroidales bacterium]|nr:hypothetical protein [Bacteroidales bacterium]
GMSLADLEQLNGSPIGFYGLGWDFGGYVSDKDEKFSNYTIALYLPDSYIATPEGTEAYLNLAGDHEYKSDNEAVKEKPFEICRISYKRK